MFIGTVTLKRRGISGTFLNFSSDVNSFLMGNLGGDKTQDWVHRL